MNRTLRILLAALVVLALGWVVAPRSAPPVYDGVGFPDEPYRFVDRPPGTRVTKAPTTAVASSGIVRGRNGDLLNATSAETGPQVTVTIPDGLLRVGAASGPVTLRATPAPALPTPRGQYLWSNVYDVTVIPAATVTTRADEVATIVLRAATAQQPPPFVARYDGGERWTTIPTSPVGLDVYAADLTGLGRFAVLGSAPLDLSALRAGGRSGGHSAAILVGVGVIAGVGALYLAGRRRRATSRRAAGEPNEGGAGGS